MSESAKDVTRPFVEIRRYVTDISLRIYDGGGTTEGYFTLSVLLSVLSKLGHA